jgi:hypothetical protein
VAKIPQNNKNNTPNVMCSKQKKKLQPINDINNNNYKSKRNSKFQNILDENFPDCPLKRNYERILQINNNNPNFKF